MATTSDAVKGLLLSDYGRTTDGTLPDLSPFIATASAVVARVSACATRKAATLSADELSMMEAWLAAHFYKQSDQAVTSESTEGASASYQGQTGMGLEGTKYGQTALSLDFTGCLAAVAKGGRRVGISWLGKTEAEQLTYRQRNP